MVSDPLQDSEGFVESLGRSGRLLGLDPGTKTIGMAISDSGWSIASPVDTIRRTKFTPDAGLLLDFARAEQVAGIVLGFPINMDGSEGPRAQAIRAFQRNLARLTGLPMLFWDERLTTVSAERDMIAADVSRAKRSGKIDQIAASIILQGALDRLRNIRDG